MLALGIVSTLVEVLMVENVGVVQRYDTAPATLVEVSASVAPWQAGVPWLVELEMKGCAGWLTTVTATVAGTEGQPFLEVTNVYIPLLQSVAPTIGAGLQLKDS